MTDTSNELPKPEKIVELYRERAAFNKDNSAVIGGDRDNSMAFSNIMLHYLELKNLLKYLQPAKDEIILDYGCGLGRLSFPIADKCKAVYGLDLSPELIEIAEKTKKEKGSTNTYFDVVKPGAFQLPDVKFDKIFALGVMIHIGNNILNEILPVMSKHLNEGGSIVLFEYTRKQTEYGPNVIIRSVEDFKKEFGDNGFECTMVKPVIRNPSYAISLWKRINRNWKFLLPLLYRVEKSTINRKPEFIKFHWHIMVFKKKKP